MQLKDLIQRTGTTERQVRYLIAEGFVPPPRGGRAHADYGEDHVDAVTRYMRLKELGFPPAAIKLLLTATAGIPFPLARGVTLVVDTSQIASGAPVAPILEQARDVLAKLFNNRIDPAPPGDPNV